MALTTRIHACHYGDTNSSKTVTELKYKKTKIAGTTATTTRFAAIIQVNLR